MGLQKMETPEFRAQLETEREWRDAELRFFHNQCEALRDEAERERFRRAMVLLLYSHFEGYCKFALLLYVSAVNQASINCQQATSAIAAAALHDIFLKLRDGSGRAPEFRNALPEDKKLHRFALDKEFIERSAEIMLRPVVIPDSVVNMESNLKPLVLRKNLYRLGLQHDGFSSHEGAINKLLESRNKIAHGQARSGIQRGYYEELRESASGVMSGITVGLTDAVARKAYLSAA